MRLLDPARIARLRQKQEAAFTPVFLHRPLAILFLIPSADWAWLTPNRITTISIVMRLVTAALVWPEAWGGLADSPATLWTAAILWHLGSVFDAMDGALARYRGIASAFGRYYDKISDRLITLTLMVAIGARAYLHTDDARYLVAAMVYVSLTGTLSTAKWITLGILTDLEGKAKVEDPTERPAPERTLAQWAGHLLYRAHRIVVVTEVDLPLWGSIALLTGKEHWLVVVTAALTTPYVLLEVVKQGRSIVRAEQAKLAAKG